MAKELPASAPPAGLLAKAGKLLDGLPGDTPLSQDSVRKLKGGPAALSALREEARLLEQRAARLRQLALALHQGEVLGELVRVLEGKEAKVDLLHAALLLARLDNDEVEVETYRDEVGRMARKMIAKLPKGAGEKEKLAELNRFLFTQMGFHGSRA